MIITLVIWGYAFCLTFLYGYISFAIAYRFNLEKIKKFSFPILNFTGLIFITIILLLASFLINIGIVVHIVVIIGAILIFFFQRNQIYDLWDSIKEKINKRSNKFKVLMGMTILFTVVWASDYILVYDSSLYHGQFIQWIEKYKVVPGLGNLHSRFAFNSSWHLVTAFFGYYPLAAIVEVIKVIDLNESVLQNIKPFHNVNGFIFILISCYLLEGIKEPIYIFKTQYSNYINIILFCFLIYYQIMGVSSPTADFPSMVFVWLTILVMIKFIENDDQDKIETYFFLIMIFAFFSVSIKLSAITILLFPVLLILFNKKTLKKRLLYTLIFAGVLLIPWVIRNIFLSGYLLYPFPELDLFNVEWKIPITLVEIEYYTIKSWAKIPRVPSEIVLAMPLSSWFPIWFRGLDYLSMGVVFLFAILTSVLIIIVSFKDKLVNLFNELRSYKILFIVLYIGIIFWFFTAPSMRFGIGFLLPLISILLVIIGKKFLVRIHPLLILGCFIVLGFQFSKIFYSKTTDLQIELGISVSQIIFPRGYPKFDVNSNNFNWFEIYYPIEGDRCGYNFFPCVNNKTRNVRLISKDDISKGFLPVIE